MARRGDPPSFLAALAGLVLLLSWPAGARAEGPAFLLDLSAGLPSLGDGNVRLEGDGTLGVATPSFGVVARGSLGFVSLDTPATSNLTLREEGYGDGFWLSGAPEDELRLELGLSGGAALYSSTLEPPDGSGEFHDEDSLMRRLTGLVGLRFRRGALVVRASVGAGGQAESYSHVTNDPEAAQLLLDSDSFSVREEGRATIRWGLFHETASTRLRLEASRFAITRTTLAVGSSADGLGAALSTEQLAQVDASARLFLDADALGFFGIVPGLFAGVELTSLSGDAGGTSAVVPVFGAGLLRPAPL